MEAVEDLVSPKEIARRLDVPVGTLEYWRQVGEGPRYFKVGRLVKYRPEDVHAWLESRGVEPLD
jgi:excisionase family DNA binding protein